MLRSLVLDHRPTPVEVDASLAYLLELRLRTRGNPEARAIVDRCLALVARAETGDGLDDLEAARELQRLSDDLALRFGAPRIVDLH